MEAYLTAFVNYEQNDWARLFPIAKFANNNAKNLTTDHTLFELNYIYHSHVSYKEDIDLRSKWKLADELSTKLGELMTVYRENLYHM